MASDSNNDSLNDVIQYYSSNDEDSRYQNQQLEFFVTNRLLNRYIPKSSKVLELGAGSGRYTEEIASWGHEVTSVELAPSLAKVAEDRLGKTPQSNSVKVHCSDARQWLEDDETTYDAVLCMGPMYHLEQKSERIMMMKAMSKRLAKDGLLVTTHLTRVGLISYMLSRFPEWGESRSQVDEILDKGFISNHPRTGDFRGYYCQSAEIKELHKNCGQKGITIFSQDPCIGAVDEIFNPLSQQSKLKWAEILADVAAEPDSWGSGRSLICFSKKS